MGGCPKPLPHIILSTHKATARTEGNAGETTLCSQPSVFVSEELALIPEKLSAQEDEI